MHHTAAPVERPDVELAGFAKVHLEPGESKRVAMVLDVSRIGSKIYYSAWLTRPQHKAFSYYSVAEHAWVGEKGTYEIHVGASSTQIPLCKPHLLHKTFRWVGLHAPKEFTKYTVG